MLEKYLYIFIIGFIISVIWFILISITVIIIGSLFTSGNPLNNDGIFYLVIYTSLVFGGADAQCRYIRSKIENDM